MVNAQEWLNKNYPNKESTTKIKRKHFTERIEGELIIKNFPNLQKIDVSSFRKGKLTKLKIINCPKLLKLNYENNKIEELEIDEISRQQLQKLGYKNNKLEFDWGAGYELAESESKGEQPAHDSYELAESESKDIITKNWTDIHEGFGKHGGLWQTFWEKQNFTYEETKKWIEIGFEPTNYNKAKQWKELGFSAQETKEWTDISLILSSYRVIKSWKDHDFTPRQAQEWIDVGLKPEEYDYAAYAKSKNYYPLEISREELRVEYHQAQNWLDFWYPKEGICKLDKENYNKTREQITKLNISNKNLVGSLDLNDFTNLKELDCSDNQLTNLDLTSRLEQLTCLNTRNNSLSEKDLFLLLQHFNSLGKLWINERSKRYDLCLECNQHQRSQQQAQILQPTNPPFDNN